jgi:hypothetical protein
MKISKIAAQCKKEKTVILYDPPKGRSEQWIGAGLALYILRGIPKVTVEEALVMLDIELTASEREKWMVAGSEFPAAFSASDASADELKQAVRVYTSVGALTLVSSDSGALFFDAASAAPLGDSAHYTVRRSATGRLYAAAMSGYLIEAVIPPVRIDGNVPAELSEIARLAREILAGQKGPQADEPHQFDLAEQDALDA